MRTLIDTSVAIALRDGDALVHLRAASLSSVALLSVISIVELEGGVISAAEGRAKRREALEAMYETLDILHFDMREAAIYADIIMQLGFSRSKVIDRMIAAQAIAAGAKLATLNPRDFRFIPGLEMEDWSA